MQTNSWTHLEAQYHTHKRAKNGCSTRLCESSIIHSFSLLSIKSEPSLGGVDQWLVNERILRLTIYNL